MTHALKHLLLIANCSLHAGLGERVFLQGISTAAPLAAQVVLPVDSWHSVESFRGNTAESVRSLSILQHVPGHSYRTRELHSSQHYSNGKYKTRSLMAIGRYWAFCTNFLNHNVKTLQEINFVKTVLRGPFKNKKFGKFFEIMNSGD